ncbi:MAG: LamG domain-containing protein [Candidatus Micrarchaeota archaeon]|nr:LamG domain-containing protein [Candidatus Micrarchaeota archaeon]
MKAQFMSVAALVLVALMVTELFIFVIITVGYDNLLQSAALSSSANNYGTVLSQSANAFAAASLSAAYNALFTYEYTPSYRGGNFITNMSGNLASLMMNGSINGVAKSSTGGKAVNAIMGNDIFTAYNAAIANITGLASRTVKINETAPVVSQNNAQSLSVRYIENVLTNSSGNIYIYHIPVNVSISLNNSPDLFYAEQGVFRHIRFANASLATLQVGNASATAGNPGYVYGTVVNVAGANPTCSAVASAVPAAMQVKPYNYTVIIAANSANSIGSGCSNKYGGWISTMVNGSATPSVPWLVYSPAVGANVLLSLPTGTKALLYGPSMLTLKIENLRNAIQNGYYFTSNFTPSYIQKTNGNITAQSPQGIYSFPLYNRQVAAFNGVPNNAILPVGTKTGIYRTTSSGITVSAWVYIPPGNTEIQEAMAVAYCNGTCSWVLDFNKSGGSLGNNPEFAALLAGGLTMKATDPSPVSSGSWHQLAATYNGTFLVLYVDGNQVSSGVHSGGISTSGTYNLSFGSYLSAPSTYSLPLNGSIADVQLYNASLSAAQVYHLYQEGIEAVPASNGALLGWWPLNGNMYDYSGYSNNATAFGTPNINAALINYTRDSVYIAPEPGTVYPIPGALNCDYPNECNSHNLPHLYMGTEPASQWQRFGFGAVP